MNLTAELVVSIGWGPGSPERVAPGAGVFTFSEPEPLAGNLNREQNVGSAGG
jgi:hypothetical protein